MTWLHLACNPEAVNSLYSLRPDLMVVTIDEIKLDNSSSPTLTMHIVTGARPDRTVPKRWPKAYDKVSIELQMTTVQQITIPCWGYDNTVRMAGHILGDGMKLLTATWASGHELRCVFDIMSIQSITGF